MHIVNRNSFQFSNFLSLDSLKSIDIRILIIVVFALGYIARAFFEPSKHKVKKIEKSSVSNTKSSNSQQKKTSSSRDEKKSSAKTQPKQIPPSPIPPQEPKTAKPTKFRDIPDLFTRSSPPAPLNRNILTICYRNILTSQDNVTSPFMKSFASQVKANLEGYTVKLKNLDEKPTSPKTDTYCVYLFFSNVNNKLKPAELNPELKDVGGELSLLKDYSILILTRDNPSSKLSGEGKIQLKENGINALKSISRGDSNAEWISPKTNESVAQEIASLVRNRFKSALSK